MTVLTDDGGIVVGSTDQEHVLHGTQWDDTALTWGFQSFTGDVSHTAQRNAIAGALASWSAVTPLGFDEVADCGLPVDHASCTTPDIRLLFGTGDHSGAGFDPGFDGPGGTAAHAFYPPPNGASVAGDVHFDDAETWRTNGTGVDLQTVALHELGHSLGLEHAQASKCPNHQTSTRPVMCGLLIGVQRHLAPDDIAGIQALYGEALPDGVGIVIEQSEAGVAESGVGLSFTVQNGDGATIVDPSLVVEGADECDDPSLPNIPAGTTYTVSCPLPPGEVLVPFTASTTLTLTATLTGTGIDPIVVGPEEITIQPPDHGFTDVPAWVDEAVDWIAYYGVAAGWPNNTYRPDDPITRAQTTRMAHRLAGEPAATHVHPFGDVPPWVDDAVDWVTDPAGPASPDPLMSGYPNGTFRPDDPISRAEVVRLLHRFAGSPTVEGVPPHGFSDVPSWVEDAVTWAAHDPDGSIGPLEPIVAGFPDGTFGPKAHITRAQVTRMLHRLAATLDL